MSICVCDGCPCIPPADEADLPNTDLHVASSQAGLATFRKGLS